MGSAPEPPAAPDIGQATREGIQAYTEYLPEIIEIQNRYQPAITDTMVDQYMAAQSALATGMQRYGDDIMREVVKLEKGYGPELSQQYVSNMRAASPGYFGIRDAYEQAVQDDLALGGDLSPEQLRLTQQAARAGQQARGRIRGAAPTAQEVMGTFLASEGLRDKRLGRAYQYAATPAPGVTVGTTPSVMQAYRGQPMPNFSSGQLNPGQGLSMGQQGASMAQQTYGQQYGGYQSAMANYQSPWATAGQLGLGAAGVFAMCWVAREVYGANNPMWLKFRNWVINHSPKVFFNWYLKNGEKYAKYISDKPELKSFWKTFMDSKIKEMEVNNA